jgi:hypothetical protein
MDDLGCFRCIFLDDLKAFSVTAAIKKKVFPNIFQTSRVMKK